MYAKPPVIYDVSLFRIDESGKSDAISNINHFVFGYRSPGPMRFREYYLPEDKIKKRFTALITHVAKTQEIAGYRYGVMIQWVRSLSADESASWKYVTPGVSS